MSEDQKKAEPSAEAKLKYYKRRSAEAIYLIAQTELRIAAARMLAVDPDAKQDYFIAMATEAWRGAVGEIACNSISDYPRSEPPPPPKLKATANPRETVCNHGQRHCVACGWESGHHVSDYESPSATEENPCPTNTK